ncbi:MAG: prolyl oligopeptidase family serine peptidase [Planctomycetota bacterium]
MSPRRTFSSTAFILATVATPLAAQKGGHEELTLDAILEHPEDFVPKLPRCGFLPGEMTAVYQVSEVPGKIEVVDRFDVKTRGTTRLFHGDQIREALRAGGASIEQGGTVPPFTFQSLSRVRVETRDGVYDWTPGTPKAERTLELFPKASASAIAPGDVAVAAIVDGDLSVRGADGKLARVTWDGHAEDIEYGGAAHRSEFGITGGLFWDAQGRRLAFYREDKTGIPLYPYADYTTTPPKPVHGRYPMAGGPNSRVTVGVYDRTDGSLRYLETVGDPDVYWTNITFDRSGEKVIVALVTRSQQQCDLVEFDAHTGKRLHTLLTETDPEWVEPENPPVFLPDGSFLWLSSRDGYRRIWHHAADGTMVWPENEGRFDVRSIVHVAADGSKLWLSASGPDPRENHLYEVRIGRPMPVMALNAQAKMKSLTNWGRGWHDAEVRDDGVVLDKWSSMQSPGMVTVLTPDGGRWIVGAAADPLVRYQVGRNEFFTVETADGATLQAHAILPPFPDVLRKAPILLYVYGGPHLQMVRDTWAGGANLWLQYMASRGYLVIRCDGRGTPCRGIEFEQAIHRHLGEIEVFDQLSAIDTAAKLFPFADRSRVGVHGWSFGGYMTLRLLTMAPGEFTCGVSGAPVTDWRQYETGYTERYMDTPEENPDGYENSSVLPFVKNLKDHLLLVQGTDDKTVMWSQSMNFLQRCIDQQKLIDFMAYPMELHGLKGKSKQQFYRLMTRYFEEHLPAPIPMRTLPPAPAKLDPSETDAAKDAQGEAQLDDRTRAKLDAIKRDKLEQAEKQKKLEQQPPVRR